MSTGKNDFSKGSKIQRSSGACRRLTRIIEELRNIQQNTFFAVTAHHCLGAGIDLLQEFLDDEEFCRESAKNIKP